MVSEAKLRANKRNAQKSTGPKSVAGKNRVRQNAVQHGLLARQAFFRGDEARGEFETILAEAQRCWQPRDFMEQVLVENLALDLWKEQVANRWEIRELQNRETPATGHMLGSLMEEASSNICLPGVPRQGNGADEPPVGGLLWDCREVLVHFGDHDRPGQQKEDFDLTRDAKKIRGFQIEARLTDSLEKLTRYAAAIRRDRDRTIAQLRRLKKRQLPSTPV